MKINEVTQNPLKALKEDIAKNNNSEFATESLQAIAEQHFNCTWSDAMTLEESLAEDARILAEAGIK